jgi:hypothetical protein
VCGQEAGHPAPDLVPVGEHRGVLGVLQREDLRPWDPAGEGLRLREGDERVPRSVDDQDGGADPLERNMGRY